MPYAKIVFGLPLEGPFDYLIPGNCKTGLKPGMRVSVEFGFKKMVGYVTGVSATTKIKKVKPLLEVIDQEPVISRNLLLLARNISDYYCCSLGEAIESILPQALRKGRKTPVFRDSIEEKKQVSEKPVYIQAARDRRYEKYLVEINKELAAGRCVAVVLPDAGAVTEFKSLAALRLKYPLSILQRNEPGEFAEWSKLRSGDVKLSIGTRASVFTPFLKAGLIILDEEDNPGYKQEQSPHYHAREVALMRSRIDGSLLILGGEAPSLECRALIDKEELSFLDPGQGMPVPEVKAIDMKFERSKGNKGLIFSKYLVDCVNAALAQGQKTLLFLNRRGFATYAFCHNCQEPLVCPRCNLSLTYYFEANILSCNHCNFRMELPKICPKCNAGYIKFRGAGTEKAESEIARIFPQAKIGKDIVTATSAVFKQSEAVFALICVLNIDNALSMPDFRACEKAYTLLLKLKSRAEKKLIIQTVTPAHPVFKALENNDSEIFYSAELKQRKSLKLPPYKHLALVRLRSKKEALAKGSAELLFEKLRTAAKKQVEALSVNQGLPAKLRGNFYYQVLLRSPDPVKLSAFIKNKLKDFRHSGIIVSVDIDPL